MTADDARPGRMCRQAAQRYQPAIVDLNRGGTPLVVGAQLVGCAGANVGVFLQLPAPEQLDCAVEPITNSGRR